ncbi:MAG TPA: STAS domain-containing protein [Steroidobacteraceae bacterium]|jgi:anti-anti-sigma regulatory factor|nr:STAS domain-containing protein [Steroidobacteraceae bacterium]
MKPARKTVRRTRKTSNLPPKSEVVVVPADCTVRNIGALRDRLCAVPDNVRNITLDLRHLQRFDSAALQLISAFTRDHSARGTNLLTCGTPAAWDEAAALLGLTATLAGNV